VVRLELNGGIFTQDLRNDMHLAMHVATIQFHQNCIKCSFSGYCEQMPCVLFPHLLSFLPFGIVRDDLNRVMYVEVMQVVVQ
jgi:hypothetical protein